MGQQVKALVTHPESILVPHSYVQQFGALIVTDALAHEHHLASWWLQLLLC